MQNRWIPYIKPTMKKHESGWRIFEVGYMVGSERAEKVVPLAASIDHVAFHPLFVLMGEINMNRCPYIWM